METQNQVPAEIFEIIKARHEAIQQKAQAEAEKAQQELTALRADGQAKFDMWLEEVLKNIPAHILPYRVDHRSNEEMNEIYEAIAKKWGWSYVLFFSIPGLTGIRFDTRRGEWDAQTLFCDDDDEPSLNWHGAWFTDTDAVLLQARSQFVKLERAREEWKQLQAERQASREKYEQEEAEREAKAWNATRAEQRKEQAEELALLDTIKHDPILLTLLKAMVLIRDERSCFTDQLNGAYESASYMEDRYSQRVADLRRQADDIERRAADEKARLQDELDDAEKKAKKLERGW
jgi:hypothetical protein